MESAANMDQQGITSSIRKISWSDIHIVKQIGVGSSGIVYEAKLQPEGHTVAVKKLQQDRIDYDRASAEEEFLEEARLMSKLHHPNIVSLHGLTYYPTSAGDFPALVIDYMRNRDLLNALLNDQDQQFLPWRSRVLIAIQAAEGMQHMHTNKVVYYDLHSGNLFVDIADRERPVCKIGDFGVAVDFDGDDNDDQSWILESKKNDVDLFGVVLWELLAGERYTEYEFDVDLMWWILEEKMKLRPVPEGCDVQQWMDLVEDCLDEDAEERPDCGEVAKRLRDILDAIPAPVQTGGSNAETSSCEVEMTSNLIRAGNPPLCTTKSSSPFPYLIFDWVRKLVM